MNRTSPTTSSLGNHLTWPFRIMCTTRPPGSVEGPKPLAGVNPPFDRSVVLFHDVVQVGTGATATAPAQFSCRLQFRDHLGVGRVAVHIDDPGARVARSTQGSLEEALRGSRVTVGGEQKIDRSAGGIDGTVQVNPLALHPNVGLIHPPGAIGGLQFAATSFVQFGPVALTQRQMVVWSAGMPPSVRSSSTSR